MTSNENERERESDGKSESKSREKRRRKNTKQNRTKFERIEFLLLFRSLMQRTRGLNAIKTSSHIVCKIFKKVHFQPVLNGWGYAMCTFKP